MIREVCVGILLTVGIAQAEVIPQAVRLYEEKKDMLPVANFPLRIDGVDIIAYGGWCTAGVEDNGPDGPHFSKSINPVITVVKYDDGLVAYVNHCKKADVLRTKEGENAATTFLEQVKPNQQFDVRGMTVEQFQEKCVPVLKGQ